MKEQFEVIRLSFHSPLHFGNGREDYGLSERIFHSDSMYAALIDSWARLGMEDVIPKSEDEDLGFTISSLFPFTKEENETEEKVYFFPRPFIRTVTDMSTERDAVLAKKIKKVKYLDASQFSKVINGEFPSFDAEHIKGRFLTGKGIDPDFIQSEVHQRVQVRTAGEKDSLPYYMDEVTFMPGSGLYFLLKLEGDKKSQDKTRKKIDAALDFLCDQGIGTDRSVGYGVFCYKWDSMELELPDIETDVYVNISLFAPTKEKDFETILGERSAHSVIRRGGWITAHTSTRKKSVYMFTEGSVFYLPEGWGKELNHIKCFGKNFNLAPDYFKDRKVFRHGLGMFLPVR